MGNKNVKKLLCHGLVFAMVCTSFANASVSDAAAKKAKLAKKTLTITKGSSKKITIKNKKKKAKYKFKASNKKIKVYSSGKVKALKVGKAKVTVKEVYKKKTRKLGTVKVTVKQKKSNNTQTKATPTPTPVVTATPTPAVTATPTPAATATPTPKPTPTPAPTATVIYNNYFEDGDTKGFGGRGSSVEVSNSENHTDGGMNSMLCTGRSATWHGASMALYNLVETGSTYQFSAWVKQDSGNAETIAMKLQYTDLDGNTQYKSIIAGTDDGVSCPSGKWTELKGDYVIPDNDGDISMYFEVTTSDSIDFLVDDVIIIGKPVDNNKFNATTDQYQKMTEDSLFSTGNNARIKKSN